MSPLSTADDADLLTRVRDGDRDAMAELWVRHYPATLAVARQASRQPKDAEEIASDAFAGMLQALSNDAGPVTSVRAYLATSVRNRAQRTGQVSSRDVLTDEVADFEETEPDMADPVAHHAELGLVREAFATLPRRWQIVLWRTAVDHDSNKAVAADLDMSPNAIASLARRARLGFRTAYVQAHISTHTVSPECEPFAPRLADLLARGARKRNANQDVRRHLDGCESCTRRLTDLETVDKRLGAALLPAILGLAPGIKWIAAAHGGAHAALGATWIKTLFGPGQSRKLASVGTAAAVSVAGICSAYALTHESHAAASRAPASSSAPAASQQAAGGGSTGGGSAGSGAGSGPAAGGSGSGSGAAGSGAGGAGFGAAPGSHAAAPGRSATSGNTANPSTSSTPTSTNPPPSSAASSSSTSSSAPSSTSSSTPSSTSSSTPSSTSSSSSSPAPISTSTPPPRSTSPSTSPTTSPPTSPPTSTPPSSPPPSTSTCIPLPITLPPLPTCTVTATSTTPPPIPTSTTPPPIPTSTTPPPSTPPIPTSTTTPPIPPFLASKPAQQSASGSYGLQCQPSQDWRNAFLWPWCGD